MPLRNRLAHVRLHDRNLAVDFQNTIKVIINDIIINNLINDRWVISIELTQRAFL